MAMQGVGFVGVFPVDEKIRYDMWFKKWFATDRSSLRASVTLDESTIQSRAKDLMCFCGSKLAALTYGT